MTNSRSEGNEIGDKYRPLSECVMDVWEGYDDFDSLDYVAFVLEENARELREAESWEEARGELADQAICALRMLAEAGDNPRTAVRERLSFRMDGQQDQIIETYKRRYRDTDSEQ